ncbi:unnamed protein product [Porites lobata]|uniref:Uncharacterized protein n=1 Tax=Porites lobata TaxID=104759 RepID=A0ABN8S3I1_9CNID|nr:unnamed protein product [Porites lobata]
MASVSVYRSYAKCVLGTKTLTLPTQDNGEKSRPLFKSLKIQNIFESSTYLTAVDLHSYQDSSIRK